MLMGILLKNVVPEILYLERSHISKETLFNVRKMHCFRKNFLMQENREGGIMGPVTLCLNFIE